MTLIGHCYLKIGLYNKAAWIFRSARRLDPYNDEIYFLIGECHYEKGEYISAINYYQKALRSEEHTSELQSRGHLVCRLLLEKKNIYILKCSKKLVSGNRISLVFSSKFNIQSMIIIHFVNSFKTDITNILIIH